MQIIFLGQQLFCGIQFTTSEYTKGKEKGKKKEKKKKEKKKKKCNIWDIG